MTRFSRWGLAFMLLVGLIAPVTARAADAPGLHLVSSKHLDARLVELTFRTDALVDDTKVRILLPKGYDASGSTRYPMLLLLHGAIDNFAAWTDKGSAEMLTAGLPVIVVMPDGGSEGNYVDWYNFGDGGPPKWETYHLRQLLPWVDAHYRTIGARGGRAVAGLSMGGNGAMAYAALHPELFAAAASFSGAVDTNNFFEQYVTGGSGAQSGKLPGAIFGERATDEIRWRGHNPWDLAANLRGLYLEIRTGDGSPGGPDGNQFDPTEEDVHEQSLAFHQELTRLGIRHVWDDYGPGGHNFFYWTRDLKQFLPNLMRVFASKPAPPSAVTLQRIEPKFSGYGWSVAMTRPALEFATLSRAGASGFTLSGSGKAKVVTPARFVPGARVATTIVDHLGTHRRTLVADGLGRLTVAVDLGTGNPYQAYSPQARANAVATSGDDGLGYAIDRITNPSGIIVRTATVSFG